MEQNDTKVFKVINGNSYELLKDFPDNYFDAIVTDPPYGLGKEPDANETLKAWIETGYIEVKGSGFMGKEWDAFVPQPIFWKEVFRVLKHGGHVLAFYGTRTYDWGVMAMRLAGFEVRDCIQWLYGSGFPKSHNISKAIDKMYGAERKEIIGERKRNVKPFDDSNGWNENNTSGNFEYTAPATEEAKQWDGWGTALKPANEPIVLARKPLEKGLSVAENILKWGVGGINIDASRIGGAKPDCKNIPRASWRIMEGRTDIPETTPQIYDSTEGRFPANIILTHHEDCVCKGTKKVKGDGNFPKTQNTESWKMASKGKSLTPERDYADTNGNEEVENWDCHEDCPIRIMDEQSGESKSSKSAKLYINDTEGRSVKNGASGHRSPNSTYADKGGASRFFYVAKASKSERNKGLDDFEEKLTSSRKGDINSIVTRQNLIKNFHPTVKPIKLMQYLVRLITPPNGIVLDPFCGSGTTGIACKLEGFEFVGIEQDAEYCKIADARIKNYTEEKQNSVKIKIDDTQLDLF